MPVDKALIAAVSENGVIGAAQQLPWHLPVDLKHFKALTWGKPIVMGRKTFLSIGKPLPGRRNIVLTRDAQFQTPGVDVCFDWEAVWSAVANEPQVMIIGGAAIYEQALPWVDRLYLTLVHDTYVGDTYFPTLDLSQWCCVSQQYIASTVDEIPSCSFLELQRRA